MTKVEAIGQRGEPVLMLSLTREDVEVLFGGTLFEQTMRSKSGIEATLMLACCEDAVVPAKLVEEKVPHRLCYSGPLAEAERG